MLVNKLDLPVTYLAYFNQCWTVTTVVLRLVCMGMMHG